MLILKLEIEIDNFLYRIKVKKLIQKLKDNYEIICSANIPNLFINIYSSNKKKIKQYKLSYEPLLKQNIVFLPRKIYRNKNKIKFNFVNSKKEIFIEPKYKTENENGSFVNIIEFLDSLIYDEQCELQNNITMVCDRFYLESYVIMEPSLKPTTKRMFAIVDNYFLFLLLFYFQLDLYLQYQQLFLFFLKDEILNYKHHYLLINIMLILQSLYKIILVNILLI